MSDLAQLQRPTADRVKSHIAEFDGKPRYYDAEKTLKLVFKQWPRNGVREEVLTKVVVLNRLYSTNIFNPYAVADHIVSLGIDDALAEGDPDVVERIADITIDGKRKFFFSFATKYCSWHRPCDYQIYDSRVNWMLWRYRLVFGFLDFKRDELGRYHSFVKIADAFTQFFGLTEFTRKEIDKFLWIEGIRAGS